MYPDTFIWSRDTGLWTLLMHKQPSVGGAKNFGSVGFKG